MSDRPWTCVYVDGDKTLLTTEMGQFDSYVARTTLRYRYPGYELRALIPGDHTSAALVAEPPGGDPSSARKAAVEVPRFVDPFETDYDSDK